MQVAFESIQLLRPPLSSYLDVCCTFTSCAGCSLFWATGPSRRGASLLPCLSSLRLLWQLGGDFVSFSAASRLGCLVVTSGRHTVTACKKRVLEYFFFFWPVKLLTRLEPHMHYLCFYLKLRWLQVQFYWHGKKGIKIVFWILNYSLLDTKQLLKSNRTSLILNH